MYDASKNKRISYGGETILMNFFIKDDDLLKKFNDNKKILKNCTSKKFWKPK